MKENKRSTIEEIKSISIVDFMRKNGYKQGQANTGKWRSFYSPFNSESNPSFKVDTNTNKFLDFSAGVLKKSSIIDLVMKLENCTFKEACNILSSEEDLKIEHFKPVKNKSGVKVHDAYDIKDSRLIDYMTLERCIDIDVLRRWTKELVISFPYGKNPSATYTVCGMQNMMKGWDFRNSFIKMASAPKSFTYIKGRSKDKVIIIEGFIDWLSFATYYGVDVPDYDVYILNGLGQLNVLKPLLENKKIMFMLDNDKPADNAKELLSGYDVEDVRWVYAFYKDMNEMLCDR